MSKRMKKIMIIIAITILSIIGINTKSNALHLAEKVGWGVNSITAGWSQLGYATRPTVVFGAPGEKTFCVQQHAPLDSRTPIPMSVINHIHIEGNKATIYNGNSQSPGDLLAEHENPSNGVMAWILSQGDPGSAGNGSYSPIQRAVYGYINTFLVSNGIQFPTATGGYTNSDYISKGISYANSLGTQEEQAVAEIQKTEPTVETTTVGDKEYIKVGPYQANISGTIDSVKVYDQDGKELSPTFAKYEGTELKTSQNPSDIISSETQFFVLLPEDGTTEEISKIEMQVHKDAQGITADIWTLSGGMKWQKLITASASSSTTSNPASLDWDGMPLVTDLEITKVNKDDHDIKLEGVSFKFKNERTGKWLSQDKNGKNIYVDNEADATVFTTGENGYLKIENIVIGTYRAYEQPGNPNYGYEVLQEGKVVQASAKKEPQLIENEQIYVKLSGYVWTDEPINSKKGGVRNDLYHDNDYDENDILMEGVTVRLKERKGNGQDEVVKETKTDKDGAYLFTEVEIKKLENYYIEFEYNGIVYTNVIPHIEIDNGSKAAENEITRSEFNSNYSTIEGENAQENTGVALNAQGERFSGIKYTRGEHTSTVNYDELQAPITANTNETGYSIKNQFKPGMEEIKFINLGLYKREQIDLSLQKDVQNARVAINGYNHTYNYENRFKNMGDYEEGFNVGVKFSNTRGTAKYTRAIYKSDVTWKEGPEEKQLNVGVTYHIRVINEATTVNAKVNSIVDYFDSRYKFEKVGTSVNEKGEVEGEIPNQEYVVEDTGDSKYKKLKINLPDEIIQSINDVDTEETYDPTAYIPEKDMENNGSTPIEEDKAYIPEKNMENNGTAQIQETVEDVKAAQSEKNYQDIYIYFTMDRSMVEQIAMMNDTDEPTEGALDNIAEISSYSAFDQSGNAYAAIDEDSAPDNIILGDEATYEDDTDKAPAFILRIGSGDNDERQVLGNVFEDLSKEGIYDPTQEHGVGNVLVQLVEVDESGNVKVDENGNPVVAKKYETDGTESYIEDTTLMQTDPDTNRVPGSYKLNGFIPGKYKIRFTWGSSSSNSMIIDEVNGDSGPVSSREYKSTTQPKEEWERKTSNDKWYKDEVDTRYSDAQDNWEKRKEIDEETREIVYGNSGAETEIDMISETPIMALTVELADYENGVTIVDTTTTANDNGTDTKLFYILENVDFGIVKRPEQNIELTKRIQNIKFILSNGQTLLESEIVEEADGSRHLKEPLSGVTYFEPSPGSGNGMLRIEVDAELLQGSTLEATYAFKAENIGEVDYADPDFYNFGIVPSDDSTLVTLSASEIVDYLNKDWGYDMQQNPGWEEITAEELDALTYNGYAMFATEVAGGTENTRILKTTNLSGQLAPEEGHSVPKSRTTTLTVSKVLASGDIDLGNETEIIHVTKETVGKEPGGKTIVTIPGNYVPGSSSAAEEDSSIAERAVVTPPTGNNQIVNYIIYTAVGILALAILGAGIVIIKKKALK